VKDAFRKILRKATNEMFTQVWNNARRKTNTTDYVTNKHKTICYVHQANGTFVLT